MDPNQSKKLLLDVLKDITDPAGDPALSRYESLRAVDAKVREAKIILQEGGAVQLLEQLQQDPDFEANSRRIRLEALANYCRTAIRFFDGGLVGQKKTLVRAPDLSKLTNILPDLDSVIQDRWLEAQKCQHAKAYLAAVIIMGSILEALLLARASMSPGDAYQSHACPKDKAGKAIAIPNWSLHTLIEVAVERGWLKVDRGKFSHALRDSRNVVHPWEHVRSRADFDEATCGTSWHVLNASVQDLLSSVP